MRQLMIKFLAMLKTARLTINTLINLFYQTFVNYTIYL